MGFIAWIILGFIGGAIGKAIVGKSMGWIGTLICGLLGGVVGGWIVGLITDSDNVMTSFFSPWSWLASILGSVIVVWIVSLMTGKSRKEA
ncbi:GlsB/YeaQ/YmgE family stress response membrane protein [Microbacterium gorillae]|uniref:GlsB/YeaQ/YmgE family stress response membrane protein n=1 Tax=Microbacterium gorillae TaxID=1231063 RepID=UPI003D9637D6